MRRTRLFDAIVLWGTGFGLSLGGCTSDEDGRDAAPDGAAVVDGGTPDRIVDDGSVFDGPVQDKVRPADSPVQPVDMQPVDMRVDSFPGWAGGL